MLLVGGAIIGTTWVVFDVYDARGEIRILHDALAELRKSHQELVSRTDRLIIDVNMDRADQDDLENLAERVDTHNTFIIDIGERLEDLEEAPAAPAKRKARRS